MQRRAWWIVTGLAFVGARAAQGCQNQNYYAMVGLGFKLPRLVFSTDLGRRFGLLAYVCYQYDGVRSGFKYSIW